MMLVSVSYFFASSPKVFVGYGNMGCQVFLRDTKLDEYILRKNQTTQIIVLHICNFNCSDLRLFAYTPTYVFMGLSNSGAPELYCL